MVKRWTGVAWVEMGSGSASVYQIPTTVRINGTTGLWEYADYVNARGINADDGLLDTRLEPLGDPPSPSIVNTLGNYHFSSSTPRLVRNTFGRPAIVFNNGDTRDGRAQYPYRIHDAVGKNEPSNILSVQGRLLLLQYSAGRRAVCECSVDL